MNLTLSCLTCAKSFAEHSGDKNAAGWAIVFMLGVLLPVLATFLFVIFRIAKREKANLDPQFLDPADVSIHQPN